MHLYAVQLAETQQKLSAATGLGLCCCITASATGNMNASGRYWLVKYKRRKRVS